MKSYRDYSKKTIIRSDGSQRVYELPKIEDTPYGFKYGEAEVVRIHSDIKLGVWISVSSKRQFVHIRVTRNGKIKIGEVTERNPKKKAMTND